MPYSLTAATRSATGRRAKTLLADGKVPAVMYGHGSEASNLELNAGEFRRILKTAGTSALIDLELAGQPLQKVLIKDVQVEPITMEPVHVDLYQIRMDEELEVEVPVNLIGESPAVKGLGGTLVQSMDEVTVKCLPGDLPHAIEVDLAMLATFEDSIAVSDIVPPKGVVILDDPNSTIATIEAPLTEDQQKKLEEGETADLSAIKTEAEEKKAAEEAKAAEEGKTE